MKNPYIPIIKRQDFQTVGIKWFLERSSWNDLVDETTHKYMCFHNLAAMNPVYS